MALTGTTIGLTNPAAGATGVDLDLTFATDAELAALDTDDADADPANELQVLSKTGTTISLSKSGGSVTETNTSLTQNNTTGVVTYTREDGTTQNANTISTNTANSITSGTDGGAYFNNPLKAFGTVTSGGYLAEGVSGVVKNGTGQYTITLSATRGSVFYPIQLTHKGTGTENVDIFISNQTTTTFRVSIVQNGFYVDRDFYFTILDY